MLATWLVPDAEMLIHSDEARFVINGSGFDCVGCSTSVCLKTSLQKKQTLPLTAEDLWYNLVNLPGEQSLKSCDGYFVRWVRVLLDSRILWLIWCTCRSMWVSRVSLVSIQSLVLGSMSKNHFCVWMVASHTPNHSPTIRTLHFKPDTNVKQRCLSQGLGRS